MLACYARTAEFHLILTWSREDTLRNAMWNSDHCKPFFNKSKLEWQGFFRVRLSHTLPVRHFLFWFKALEVIKHHVDSKKLMSYYLWDNLVFSELLEVQRNWSCRPTRSHEWGTWSLALLAINSVSILLLSIGECELRESHTSAFNARTWHFVLTFHF